jgi:uncharacterized membrane protein
VHIIPSRVATKAGLIERFGENRYKTVYSILSLLGIALIAWGYTRIEYIELWAAPVWAPQLALVVMPMVFVLWISAETKGHIRKMTKHPMLLGMILWALIHLVNNGDRASLYLFGAFGLYSLYALIANIRSPSRSKKPDYPDPSIKQDIKAFVVGLVLYVLMLLLFHEFMFGVAPPY